MHAAVLAAVFPVVFVGELPDKTMFASLLLATRGRPLAVWAGAAAAFVVHVALAVTVGVAAFHLLGRRTLAVAVAAVFALGAAYAAWEARRAARSAHEDHEARLAARAAGSSGPWRVALAALAVVFVAEWGDLTQVLTADLAARYHDPLSVAVGALAALWAVAALAVAGGRGLLRVVDVGVVRAVTAVVLLGLAGYEAWQAAAG